MSVYSDFSYVYNYYVWKANKFKSFLNKTNRPSQPNKMEEFKMNKRFTEINEFMESVRALTDKASALSITHETIAHICAIDPEFTQDVERLMGLFTTSSPFEMDDDDEATTTATTVTTTTATATTDITDTDDTNITTAPTASIESETNEETEKSEEVEDDGNWKVHPKMKDYRLSPDGRVQRKSSSGWTDVKIIKRYGYLIFDRHQLAREMLNTFKHIGDRSLTPFYKDGDKYNCHIDNLEWTTSRNTKKDTNEIEKACKIISENSGMNKSNLCSKLLDEAHVGRTCYESIMRGAYMEISEKYFHIHGGKVYPLDTNELKESKATTTAEAAVTEAEDIRLIDLISFTKDPALIRSRFPNKPSRDDVFAVILSYVADGKRTAADIQMAVHKDFGKRLYIANQDIEKILTKSVHKDICDKIF